MVLREEKNIDAHLHIVAFSKQALMTQRIMPLIYIERQNSDGTQRRKNIDAHWHIVAFSKQNRYYD